MKPAESKVNTLSTLTSQSHVMGIDEEGMATILSILSNMYSDGSLAVVREYSCNALDSQVAAGNPEPILITAPTPLSPKLTIQDFGLGLSHDEMLNVYAKYGASTKRDTNDQIGSFGIGAKSAFTIGTQFTVTAVKDGMQTVALFALNSDGSPTVNILLSSETNEPNGVKVEIGVSDTGAVNNAIERLFKVWKPGTVLIDGAEPSTIWDSADEIAEGIYLDSEIHDQPSGSWVIVMGGIPYPVSNEIFRRLRETNYKAWNTSDYVSRSRSRVFLIVPIGAVDITPSREELRDTNKTVETIADKILSYSQMVSGWASKEISDSESIISAMINFRMLRDRIGNLPGLSPTWNGINLLKATTVFFGGITWFRLRRKRGSYYGEKVAGKEQGLNFSWGSAYEKTLFVIDVPDRRTRSVQLSAKPFLNAESNKGFNAVVAITGSTKDYDQDWFSLDDPALHTIDFDSFLKEWKPERKASGKKPVEYSVGHETLTPAELNEEDAVYYASSYIYTGNPLIKSAIGDSPLVTLTGRQSSSVFLKRVPGAIDVHQAMRDKAKEILDNITENDADRLALPDFPSVVSSELAKFLVRNKNRITNDFVLEVIGMLELASTLSTTTTDRDRLITSAVQLIGKPEISGKSSLKPEKWDQFIREFPLLSMCFKRVYYSSEINGLTQDHLINYINTVQRENDE